VPIQNYILTLLGAYLLGSIPTGFLAAKAKGIDIRSVGSGNIGATNAMRVLGKPVGIAVLLLERKAGLAQFQTAVVQRPDVQEWIRRVNYYVDPEAEAAGFARMTSIIKIHLKNGTVLTGRADMAKGSPSNPMSFEEAADKFSECADFAQWPRAKAATIIEAVKSLERAPDMAQLATALTVQ